MDIVVIFLWICSGESAALLFLLPTNNNGVTAATAEYVEI